MNNLTALGYAVEDARSFEGIAELIMEEDGSPLTVDGVELRLHRLVDGKVELWCLAQEPEDWTAGEGQRFAPRAIFGGFRPSHRTTMAVEASLPGGPPWQRLVHARLPAAPLVFDQMDAVLSPLAARGESISVALAGLVPGGIQPAPGIQPFRGLQAARSALQRTEFPPQVYGYIGDVVRIDSHRNSTTGIELLEVRVDAGGGEILPLLSPAALCGEIDVGTRIIARLYLQGFLA